MRQFKGKKALDRHDIKQPHLKQPEKMSSKKIAAWNKLISMVGFVESAE